MTDAFRTTSLEELIKRTAFDLGDLVMAQATQNSDTATEFVDAVNFPTGNEGLVRRQIFITSGPSRGHLAVITGFDGDAHAISIEPPTPTPVMTGETACIINKKGMGFVYLEYVQALQQAQDDAYPLHRVPVVSIASAFDSETGIVTVPTTMNEVYEIQVQDDEGDWYPVPKSVSSAHPGWQVHRYSNQIIVNGYAIRDRLDGYNIRVLGEGKEDPLTTYDSTTGLHPDYMVSTACYKLSFMGMERDITGTRARQVGVFADKAERNKALIRVHRQSSSAPTRSS